MPPHPCPEEEAFPNVSGKLLDCLTWDLSSPLSPSLGQVEASADWLAWALCGGSACQPHPHHVGPVECRCQKQVLEGNRPDSACSLRLFQPCHPVTMLPALI